MKNIAIKSILSVAALTLTAGISLNSTAGELGETFVHGDAVRQTAVTYSRHELASEEGRAVVEQRIQKAAESVCGPMNYRTAGGLSALADNKECYNQAIAQAMSQIDTAQVASLVD